MSKLVELPNGSWVDPATVRSVIPLPTAQGFLGNLNRARVIVWHGSSGCETLLMNDDAHAVEQARELALKFNELRS